MYYIIFDLEWNNSYSHITKSFVNEIIEIGAVKLNRKLEIVDTFKQLIKPTLSKKMCNRFKNLTNITVEEIEQNGIDFNSAFHDFALWSREEGNIFLSWSSSDLYTLVFNNIYINKTSNIDFIGRYADAQKYCMNQMHLGKGSNQISLATCAQKLEIEINENKLHRALTDCYVTAFCVKKLFDYKKFMTFVSECDKSFFERLIFKPYFIDNNYEGFDIKSVELVCPMCGGRVKPLKAYQFNYNSFKNAGQCLKCKNKFWITIRAKKNYDNIKVSQCLVQISKKREKFIN